MDYQFREIRKGECAKVLEFACANGGNPGAESLRHHLSLGVHAQGDFVAAALCVKEEPNHYSIQVVHNDEFDQTLIPELADRCLRKMQAEGIAAARLTSPSENATQRVWTHANWLDQIEETLPPEVAQATNQVAQPA